jgi:hypothetical protein
MTLNRGRLAGMALMIGGILTIAGYAAVNTFAGSSGDARFSNPLWIPLYGLALAGDLITVLGLPAILMAHGQRAYRLTTVGFTGVLLAIVMLNIGEGTTEGFVKPYLATHGGIPNAPPAGFDVFVGVALLFLVVGLISLGVAVIRARVFPRWVGGLLILSLPLSLVQLPGPLAEIGDYLAFFALAVIGWIVTFGYGSRRAVVQDLARSSQASA